MRKWKSAAFASFRLPFTNSVFHSETNLTDLRKAQKQRDEWTKGIGGRGIMVSQKAIPSSLGKGSDVCDKTEKQNRLVWFTEKQNNFTCEQDRMPTCRKRNLFVQGSCVQIDDTCWRVPVKVSWRTWSWLVRFCDKVEIYFYIRCPQLLCVWGICWGFFISQMGSKY